MVWSSNKPLNPQLARWLGNAILRAGKDNKKLLINLGLAKPKGKPSEYDQDAWLTYGAKLADFESGGLTKEQAIEAVQATEDIPRQTLQKWRNIYLSASKDPAT